MTDLSPAAQAVLDAFLKTPGEVPMPGWNYGRDLAAALRATADQVVPEYETTPGGSKVWQSEPVPSIRAARRPKPPSLKEQALALVEQHEDGWRPSPKDWDTIRRALEALPE